MIHVYHHIWSGGAGIEIAKEQKKRLYENISDEFIYHPNTVGIKENECHTLIKMLDEIKKFNDDDYVLYFHTKGASKPNELYEIEWREYMELSLIDDYKTHVKMLDDGFDVSGVLMGSEDSFIRFWSGGFYGGNFWWTRVKFLNKIPKNIKEIWGTLQDRHMAEWCFLNKIDGWKPGVIKPSFDKFDNFYDFIKKESAINLSKQYVSRKGYWKNSSALTIINGDKSLTEKTIKTFI